MPAVPLTDEFFHGHISLQRKDGWVQPWRLRHEQRRLFHPGAVEKAACPSGVRLRFAGAPDEVTLRVQPLADARPFDLCRGNELIATCEVAPGASEARFAGLGGRDSVYELWLPVNPAHQRLTGLESDAELAPATDDRPRWVTYGSSITMCGGAFSPARTWPATAARLQNVHLTSLGLGGNCHLEPLWGQLMSQLPADFITLKLGINVYGGGTLSERTFRTAAIGLVQWIRERQPTTPIGLVGAIYSPPRETTKNRVDFTLQEMREALMDAVDALQSRGDRHVQYFDGLELLGPADAELLPDNLHPNGEGYELIGRRFAARVIPALRGA